MRKETVKTGVVAEFEGQYWGILYEDGQSTTRGFGTIENATISNLDFCARPRDMTYPGSHDIEQLDKARLLAVKITTIYEVDG